MDVTRDFRCWHKADIRLAPVNVRFLGVKRTSRKPPRMFADDPLAKFVVRNFAAFGFNKRSSVENKSHIRTMQICGLEAL